MYYVYIYIRPDTNEVFYVGKGTGDRYKHHLDPNRCSNRIMRFILHKIHTQKLAPIIKIIFRSDSEKQCFDLEQCLIAFYGRMDLKNGSLANMTDGGDGMYFANEQSHEHFKEKHSGFGNNAARPLMLNYRIYPTVKTAALEEEIPLQTLIVYLREYKINGFPDGWKYLTKYEYQTLLDTNYCDPYNLPKFGHTSRPKLERLKQQLAANTGWHPSKPIIFEHKEYTSIRSAAKLLGINKKIITRMIKQNYDGCRFIVKE